MPLSPVHTATDPARPVTRMLPRATARHLGPVWRTVARAACLCCGLFTGAATLAQTSSEPVGQVEFARGVGYAQSPGQNARILGKGLEFREGDTLSTSGGGSAIIRMQDGTRMTLRPGAGERLAELYRACSHRAVTGRYLEIAADSLAPEELATRVAVEVVRAGEELR